MAPGFLALLIIIILLVAAIAIVVAMQNERKRTEAIRALAERLGWGFRDEIAFKSIPDLDRFELFRTGHGRKLRHLLTSPGGVPRAVVFDYSYKTSGGNSQQRHRQTVFYATGENLDLPSFSLRSERFLHRVASMLGYQDIDLDGQPEFSRLFLLRGEDEAAIRQAFTGAVAEFFEQRPGTCAAGLGHELLLWRPGRRAKPDEIESLIQDGFELAERFTLQPR